MKRIIVFKPATSRERNQDAMAAQVSERNFELILIHDSVIYQISKFTEITEFPFTLGEPLLNVCIHVLLKSV